MAFTIILSTLFFLLSPIFLLLRFRKIEKLNLPPGPFNLPLIGNLHKLSNLPHISLHKLSRKHGPLMYLKLGTVPTIVASSPGIAKEILKTHDSATCNRPKLTAASKLSYESSDIGFSPYNDQWRDLRRLFTSCIFSSKKVTSCRSIREEEVERLISSISCKSTEFNLHTELIALSNDITCRTALGKRYYGGGSDDVDRILKETEALLMGFFFEDYVPFLGWLDKFTGMRGRLERNFQELDGFYQRVIDEHKERERRDEDAVDVMLDLQKAGMGLSDNQIKGLLMNIFIAGSETTSMLVEWIMTELMRKPEVMKKTQNEIRHLIGTKGKVEESDLNQLHYIKLVIKETLRLHPPGPILVPKETIQHCKINGYDIPGKSRLFINAWTIGRDADAWENPEEFYPERFIDSPVDFKGHHFELIPFGAGRRICPGMQSGMLVVELVLANLLHVFDWELPKGMAKEKLDMDEAPGLSVSKKVALCLVAKKFVEMEAK